MKKHLKSLINIYKKFFKELFYFDIINIGDISMTKKNNKKVSTKKVIDEEVQKKATKDILFDLFPYLVVVIVVILIRTYIATPIRVTGTSMEPTLYEGQVMILNKIGLKKGINRSDIVVIKSADSFIIKRVIGLPGDTVVYKDNILYVNGKKTAEPYIDEDTIKDTCYNEEFDICSKPVKLSDDEYYVLGDHRYVSKDSRLIGPVRINQITGKTNIIIFPFNKIGKVK